MSKYLFVIHDQGTSYGISDTRVELDNHFVVDPTLYIQTNREDFFNQVGDLLKANNTISYSKISPVEKLTIENIILLKSKTLGDVGLSIRFLNPLNVNRELSVSIIGNDITVNLATNENGVVISTAAEIISIINTTTATKSIIEASSIGNINNIVSLLDKTFLTRNVVYLEIEELTVSSMNALEIHRSATKTKGKSLLKQRCDFVIQFDFFIFSTLNNKLINAGYVITDENREVKYLEIINTGNEILISNLDEYLECLDRITVSVHNYKNYLTFAGNVDTSATIEEVDTAYYNFSSLYF